MPGAAPSVQATAASMKVTITENDNARGIISFNSSTVRGKEREEGEKVKGIGNIVTQENLSVLVIANYLKKLSN